MERTRTGDGAELLRVLKAASGKGVRFSKEEKRFMLATEDGEKPLSGLVKKLARAFWPTYEYVAPPCRKRKRKGERSDGWTTAGMTRGSVVHQQIELHVNKGGERAVRVVYDALHPFAAKAIRAMELWGWTPIIAEFAVYDPVLNLATNLDLVCLDRDRRIVLVEWKCGMEGYADRGNDEMRGPLRGSFSNCPLHQAYLQLLFGKMLLELSYDVRVPVAYVVRIREGSVDPYRIPVEMQNAQAACYEHLYADIQKRKGATASKRRVFDRE